MPSDTVSGALTVVLTGPAVVKGNRGSCSALSRLSDR